MKRVLALLTLVSTATFAAAAGERTTMKYDLGAETPKWKFVAGQWIRRPSENRQVLAQTVETQPWAVAVLEDKKFSDADISALSAHVRSGGCEWRHHISREGWPELSPRARQCSREQLPPFFSGRSRTEPKEVAMIEVYLQEASIRERHASTRRAATLYE